MVFGFTGSTFDLWYVIGYCDLDLQITCFSWFLKTGWSYQVLASYDIKTNVFWFLQDGLKMGKSLGNTIEPRDLLSRFGVDAVRYYFLKEIEFGKDGDFSEERFINIVNANLANTIGILYFLHTCSLCWILLKELEGWFLKKNSCLEFLLLAFSEWFCFGSCKWGASFKPTCS